MKLHFLNLSEELLSAVAELQDILHIELSEEGFPVTVETTGKGLSVTYTADGAVIGYHKKAELYRAIGRLTETAEAKENVREIPQYEDLCVMYDCSRGSVMSVEGVKTAIRHLALMGYTAVELYTEDTYEVEGYPYFGHMRGRYTVAEMKELDAYGLRFGIELIPCIQVLAHLNQIMRWNAFQDVRDCTDILLVDEPKTYELIEAMFATVSKCFTSRRINIGMDEARLLGAGNYMKNHGMVERWEIMQSHLAKVKEIGDKYGFCMHAWSDMYINNAFGHRGYYYPTRLEEPHMPQNIIASVPAGTELVYWEYGGFYDANLKMMKLHKEFNNTIWFAGGATKWAGYAPMNLFSMWVSRDQLRACKDAGIEKVMVTCWTTDGGMSSNMAVWPTIQLYAETCYADNNENEWLAGRFKTCVDGDFEDFLLLDYINFTPDNPAPGCGSRNACTYLLHQDVLLGLFDRHQDPETYPQHFADVGRRLRAAGERNPRWQYLFDMLAADAEVLELKAAVGANLKAAYDSGDKATMRDIAENVLPEIARRMENFNRELRVHWLAENKVFGIEFCESALAGLCHRIGTAIVTIEEYLDGKTTFIPELEEQRLFYDGNNNTPRNLNMSITNIDDMARTAVKNC